MKEGDLCFVLTSVVSQLQRSGDDIRTLWESFKLISFYPKYMASKPSKNRASSTITKKACSVQEGMVPSGPWHPPRGNIYQCFLSCRWGYGPKFGQRSISMACYLSANLTCAAQGCSRPHRVVNAAGIWQHVRDLHWPFLRRLWIYLYSVPWCMWEELSLSLLIVVMSKNSNRSLAPQRIMCQGPW